MYAAIVPTIFTGLHTLRSHSEGMTRADEEISMIGLIMIVLITCVELYVNKTIAFLFVLPPMILVTMGPLYQRLRYNRNHVKQR